MSKIVLNPIESLNFWHLKSFFVQFKALKGVFAKNEREYMLNAIKKALLIATNLTSICCDYKKEIVKNYFC